MSMTGKVYTWKEALRAGYDPRQYTYIPASPGGVCIARLDFKMWSQNLVAINGYFTVADSTLKVQVTIYPSARYGYRIGADRLDVFACLTGMLYRIEVLSDKGGRWVLQNIAPV